MRRAARTDENQQQIVSALLAVGASVHLTHTQGGGFPDLVVGRVMPCPYCRRHYPQTRLIEVKGDGGSLTSDQETFHRGWRGHIAIARTVDEALAQVGATGVGR